MTEFGIAELCSSPIVKPARKWEVTSSKSAAETARNKNRGYSRDMMVKTFGRLYNEFLPIKRSIVQENGVWRAHEVPTRQGCAPTGVGHALHPCGALVSFPDCFLFFYFSKYSKRRKISIRTVLESVYLPYYIPIPFRSLKRSGRCPLCIPSRSRFQ